MHPPGAAVAEVNGGDVNTPDSGTQRIIVADPTTFATYDTQIADLTGGISTTLGGRLAGLRNESATLETVSGFAAEPEASGHTFWFQGFGSYRQEKARGTTGASEQRVAGFVIGADGLVDGEPGGFNRAGLFGGLAWGRWEPVGAGQESESQSFFGGGYASAELEDYTFDLILTAGYQGLEQRREVSNNLGSIETGLADYSGWFISPELRLTKATDVYGHLLEGSIGLRYAGLFLDGFTETGTSAPLTLEDRTVHMGVARAELALPFQLDLNGKRRGGPVILDQLLRWID